MVDGAGLTQLFVVQCYSCDSEGGQVLDMLCQLHPQSLKIPAAIVVRQREKTKVYT